VEPMPPIAALFAASALLAAPHSVKLSNELTTNVWAHPARDAAVRDAPSHRARVLAHLHAKTEMGSPEVYELLSVRGRWVHIRIPGLPNGRSGYVPQSALGAEHETHTALVVSKRTLTATLLVDGKPRWRAPVAIGAPATPTPNGHFYVRELLQLHPATTSYGPFIFGTSGYAGLSDFPVGGIIGVHGTSDPASVPGHASHGCVRMRNADVAKLAKLLPVGAPVRIS
jgi:L,D-transpeptidase catalytic domain